MPVRDRTKLQILVDLRQQKPKRSQEWVAEQLGLRGVQARQTIGKWEIGDYVPDEGWRKPFIRYVWLDRGLCHDPAEFYRVWAIIPEEQWGWAPVREEEIPADPPFKGLQYYDEADAHLFFGRERLTAELVAHLRQHSFLAVVGASGSGKSSLVRAGLVPTLKGDKPLVDRTAPPDGSTNWLFRIITPTATPLISLAKCLDLECESALSNALACDPHTLDRCVHEQLAQSGSARLLLVVDQFEELFTECQDKAQQTAFIDNLLTAALVPSGQTIVVLTLRADYYGRCGDFAQLRTALEEYQRYIGPMSREELRTAIEAPAHHEGWDFQPGLVNLMLDEVGDELGALPLLSHALLETWQNRQGRIFTLEGYDRAGRVEHAIANTADKVYQGLDAKQQQIARSIFLRLTELGEGAQDTRHRVELEKLVSKREESAIVEEVLSRLVDARLITVFADAAEVAHEALIRRWLQLKKWLEQSRVNLPLRRQLATAAQQWKNLERNPGALYRGLPLQQALAWAQEHEEELNELERAFLSASRQQREQEEAEKVQAHQREIRHAIAQKRRAQWISVLLAVAVIAVASAFWLGYDDFKIGREIALRDEVEQIIQGADAANAAAIVEEATGEVQGAAFWLRWEEEQVDEETADIKRKAAEHLVRAAEAMLRAVQARLSGGQGLTPADQQEVREAYIKFQAAVDLNPPPDTRLYVWISAGEFLMGADDADPYADADEKPQGWVDVAGFWMMRTEVTNAEYKRCLGAGKCAAPETPWFWEAADPETDPDFWRKVANLPVTGVTWHMAMQYAQWVGGRLPSEAEWEKACRGTDGRRFPWGNTEPTPQQRNARDVWTPVGSYLQGASSFGVYDMAGNAGEWTSSSYVAYSEEEPEVLTEARATDRLVMRGLTFYDRQDCMVRSDFRPGQAPVNAGFRVVFPDLLTAESSAP